LLDLALDELLALHPADLLLASQMTGHGSLVHKADLLPFSDLHWLVGEVDPSEERGKLAVGSSRHRRWSNEALAILRELGIFGVLTFSLFAYREQLSAAFDASSVNWSVTGGGLASFWRLICALILAIDSIKAVRESALNRSICSEAGDQSRWQGLSLGELWYLSCPHEALVHVGWFLLASLVSHELMSICSALLSCRIDLILALMLRCLILLSILALILGCLRPHYLVLSILRSLDHLVNLCEERSHGLGSVHDPRRI